MTNKTKVQLQPNPEQWKYLRHTLHVVNDACNAISAYAWEHQILSPSVLYQTLYHDIRGQFDLHSQIIVQCFAKVGKAYRLDKSARQVFEPDSAIIYDDRILDWRFASQIVSIWSVGGRLRVSFAGEKQVAEEVSKASKTFELSYSQGKFYLSAGG
jgi:hypothetical protein